MADVTTNPLLLSSTGLSPIAAPRPGKDEFETPLRTAISRRESPPADARKSPAVPTTSPAPTADDAATVSDGSPESDESIDAAAPAVAETSEQQTRSDDPTDAAEVASAAVAVVPLTNIVAIATPPATNEIAISTTATAAAEEGALAEATVPIAANTAVTTHHHVVTQSVAVAVESDATDPESEGNPETPAGEAATLVDVAVTATVAEVATQVAVIAPAVAVPVVASAQSQEGSGDSSEKSVVAAATQPASPEVGSTADAVPPADAAADEERFAVELEAANELVEPATVEEEPEEAQVVREDDPTPKLVEEPSAPPRHSSTERAERILTGHRGEHQAAAHAGPSVDAARFVSRVSRAFESAHEQGGPIRLRLSPPELGAVRIELTMQQGVLSAQVETETPSARTVLLDNLPALRERLAEQDIRVDKFNVDVSTGQHDGGADWEAPRDQAERAAARQARRSPSAPPTPTAVPTLVSRSINNNGQFNAVA